MAKESFLSVKHTANSGKRRGKKRNRDDGLQYNLLSRRRKLLEREVSAETFHSKALTIRRTKLPVRKH